ncbi:hypothetical protein OP10G_2880 [Fimbriimonas ginsengisoli Gsoil 348]|uniref:Uncharacterized protein n=1 Tax=Fimbriimonas ginsengisoli Gsoil 348 TaxID=661478 RepID=A0A068NRS1_FIMGI|nr:hypothetical protein OP10G_2880 [Fimbriimonas ginsengisoli Gsoil 348]
MALSGGWTPGQSRDGSVTLAVAPGWRVGVDKADNLLSALGSAGGDSSSDPNGSALSADLQRMAADSDRRSQEMEQKELASLEKRGIVIQVINGSRPTIGEDRTKYYVVRHHLSGNVGWAEATDAERRHYAYPPKPEEVKLPIGKAYRFFADDKLRDGSDRHQISYVVIDGEYTYTLRFLTQEDAQTISSIADPVAQSWRIHPTKPL